jgi:hypothetical protein
MSCGTQKVLEHARPSTADPTGYGTLLLDIHADGLPLGCGRGALRATTSVAGRRQASARFRSRDRCFRTQTYHPKISTTRSSKHIALWVHDAQVSSILFAILQIRYKAFPLLDTPLSSPCKVKHLTLSGASSSIATLGDHKTFLEHIEQTFRCDRALAEIFDDGEGDGATLRGRHHQLSVHIPAQPNNTRPPAHRMTS